MFAVTAAAATEPRQWLKSSGLLTPRPGGVPPLSAYACQSSVSLFLALQNKTLVVRQGKGRRDRFIPLVDDEVKAIRNYLRYRATELVLDDDTLFLAKNGTSLNVSTVKYIVAKYVKKPASANA